MTAMTALLLLLLDSRSPGRRRTRTRAGWRRRSAAGLRARPGRRWTAFLRGPAARRRASWPPAFAAARRGPWRPRRRRRTSWLDLDRGSSTRGRRAAATRGVRSRALGSGAAGALLRAVQPEADAGAPWTLAERPAPHHPLVLGAAARAGGRTRDDGRAGPPRSARAPGRLSAAVRLLGLDPFAVQAVLAGSAPDDRRGRAGGQPSRAAATAADLPAGRRPLWTCCRAPRPTEVRLFAS